MKLSLQLRAKTLEFSFSRLKILSQLVGLIYFVNIKLIFIISQIITQNFKEMIQKTIILTLIITFFITISHAQSVCNSNLCLCSSNSCTNCLSSVFYKNSTSNTCQLCDYRCQTCDSSQNCSTCASGYFLDSTIDPSYMQCIQCPVFCNKCPNQTYCTKCIDGYVSINGVCKACALPNALSCQSQMTVYSCRASYWKNGDSCSPCRQFCQQCTSSTNCLKCSDGFRVEVSAGTYCVSCPTECKTCSTSTTCTSCIKNYRLISGSCLSIQAQCKNIQNCQQCQYSSTSVVRCKVCVYPYYLSSPDGSCVLGASLMCTNGAASRSRHDCLNSCGGASQQVDLLGDRHICGPMLWIAKTDIKQHYYQALTSWDQFYMPNPPHISCPSTISAPVVYSPLYDDSKNTITLQKILKPYYKLIISVKAYPLYKQIMQTAQIDLIIRMKDNSTNVQQYLQTIDTSTHTACKPTYFTIQSKLIKDQNVTISFEAQLRTNSTTLSTSSFGKGLMGYSQILIQLYRCSPQCRICSNSKYCIQCYGGLFAYQNQCVTQCFGFYQFYAPSGNPSNYTYKSCLQKCPTGFYSTLHPNKTGVYTCTQCLSPCLTCKSQIQCLSCVSPYLYYDLGFVCLLSCPNTHYSNVQAGVCVPCNSPCRTCINQSTCLSCSIGFFYAANSTCVGVCPGLNFANITSRNCEPCDTKCTKCINSPTNCLSCTSNYYLLGSSCLSSCPSLTHYAINNKCQTCKPPCLQCTSQTQCVNCISGYLLNTSCYSQCPQGYFGNFTGNTCDRCPDSNCLMCTSSTSCELCVNSTYLYNSGCLAECPGRTYASVESASGASSGSINNICLPCVQPCYQCTNSTYCISCQIGYMSQVEPGKCVGVCQSGYYAMEISMNTSGSSYNTTTYGINVKKVCSQCSPDCLTCKQYSACLTCANQTKVLTPDHKCAVQCPIGYYNHNQVCQLCNYPCLTCQNTPQSCLSCYQPYILTGSSCVSQCGVAQYQRNYQCHACVYPCRTCANQGECKSCVLASGTTNIADNHTNTTVQVQTYLWNNSCLTQCPTTTYSDPITLKCKPCSYPCATCQDSKKCLTCIAGYLNPSKNTCQTCPQTSFPNQVTKQCQACNTTLPNCHICSSSSTCRYCNPQHYLYLQPPNSTCIDQTACKQIPKHYTNTQQMSCSPCIPPCGQCTAQNKCITCMSGYLLNSKCLLQCPNGYYSSIFYNTCQLCDSLCATCSGGPANCLSCNVSGSTPVLMVSQSMCIARSQCPEEYYVDESFGYGRCLRCQAPCLMCSGARVCTSCISGILYHGECKTSCPISYYQSITSTSTSTTNVSANASSSSTSSTNISQQTQTASCLPCSPNCLRCRNTSTQCISCPQDKYLQSNTCVSKCSDGHYLDISTLQCKYCSSPCKKCISASHCLTCLSVDANGNNLVSNRIIYYGQCLQVCPDGTYQNNGQCVKCPDQCQLCGNRNISTTLSTTAEAYCKKCSPNLYMNSSSPGKCSPSCQSSQYPDPYTRSCYSCQPPCVTCLSATLCRMCEDGYIIYKNDCIKGDTCLQGTFKSMNEGLNLSQCVDECNLGYFGNSFVRECVKQCPYNYVKFQQDALCVEECPTGYYLGQDLLCKKCAATSTCKQLLRMSIKAKSIFNTLYIRINFNQQLSLGIFKSSQNASNTNILNVEYRNLDNIYDSSRRLLQSRSLQDAPTPMQYKINPLLSTNTIWLQINTLQSLGPIQIKVILSGHYLFPGKILQNSNSSTILYGFDKYSQDDVRRGQGFQKYAKIVSYIMCILFMINLVFNTGYLMYPMVDFYQLLFLLMFLNVDFPPVLNYFMYGFRYAHYLFLPQILNNGRPTTLGAKTPQKFGIVVPDANFLNNTGHDFLIMFVVIGVFSLLKLCDFIYGCFEKKQLRSNKIKNQIQDGQKSNKNTKNDKLSSDEHNIDINHKENHSNDAQTSQSSKVEDQKTRETPLTFGQKLRNLIKMTVNRIRWNYFNDFLYIMYFYLMLFAFCQTYDMTAKEGIHYASSIFAVVFIILGISWPIGLGIMLYYRNNKNQVFVEQEYEQSNQVISSIKYHQQYKCYVANLKPKSTNLFGLFQSPIRYSKKLILSLLFAFCSNYQNFIIGIIIMFGILTVITALIYRPFKNRVELFGNCVFEGLFCLGCICLCILMATNVKLGLNDKMNVAILAVAIFLILSIVLCVYNCAMICLQTVQYFTGMNYMQKYDEADSETDQIQPSKDKNGQAEEQTNTISEDSNLRLNISLSRNRKFSNEALIGINRQQVKGDEQKSNESGQSGGLDIYLKKDPTKSKSPQILIKCIKGAKFEEDSQNKQNCNQSEQSSQISQYHKKDFQNKLDENQRKHANSQDDEQDNQSPSKQYNKNIFESMINQSQRVEKLEIKNVIEVSDDQQSDESSEESEVQKQGNKKRHRTQRNSK